jgi:type II secretory pathway pseudopilin PulG
MKNQGTNGRGNAGYAMAALLVAIAVMGVLMTAAMPSWKAMVQREREEELVFRGEQYARAVGLFQRKFAGGFPPSVDVLVEQKFLRKKYKDPMAADGEFQIIYQNSLMAVPGQAPAGATARPGMVAPPTAPGLVPVEGGTGTSTRPGGAGSFGQQTAGPRGGIVGVASKSTKSSYKLYKGRSKYNEWQFVYTQASQRIGVPGGGAGQPQPGMPGGRGGQGRPGGPGTGGGPGGGFQRPFGSGSTPQRPGSSFSRPPQG